MPGFRLKWTSAFFLAALFLILFTAITYENDVSLSKLTIDEITTTIYISLIFFICVLFSVYFSKLTLRNFFGINIYEHIGNHKFSYIVEAILIFMLLFASLYYATDIFEIFEFLEIDHLIFILILIFSLGNRQILILSTAEHIQVTNSGPGSESDLYELQNSTFQIELRCLPNNRAVQIIDFRERADSLLKRSDIVLWIIISVLIFSAVFIVFAGAIAEFGTSRVDYLADVRAQKKELQNRLSEAKSTLTSLDEELEEPNAALFLARKAKEDNSQSQLTPEKLAEYEAKTLSIEAQKLIVKEEIVISNARINLLNEELSNIRGQMLSKQTSPGNNQQGVVAFDQNLLIAAGVTRFGVLIIGIYLVQILIGLYRYNTRLAAFYRAQADALLLLDHDVRDIEELHTALWPDLDYGKTPSTIPQRIADAFSNATEKVLDRTIRKPKEPEASSAKT